MPFCTYFTNTGPSLAKNVQSSHSHRSFRNGSFTQSIYFNPTITDASLLKLQKHFFLARPLVMIKSQCLSSSSPYTLFLNRWPISPVFKSDDQSLFTNYRPVSVLPSFSIFLERIIYNRLMQYFSWQVSAISSVIINMVSEKIILHHSHLMTCMTKFLPPFLPGWICHRSFSWPFKSLWYDRSCHPFWQTRTLWNIWFKARLDKELLFKQNAVCRI